MNGSDRSEIEAGDVVVIPAAVKISLRASQLGDMRLCHFGVRAEQLVGFFTAEERELLGTVPTHAAQLPRIFKRDDTVARQHAELCNLQQCEPGVLVRSAMLSVAVRALRDILTPAAGHLPQSTGPEQKFSKLMARIPESELLSNSTKELARQCGCTERHFRRLFVRRFGVSLKQRQVEWRIERAKKLLLETEAKIIDIASQCGFRSLGQFNLTFKRLTRMPPSVWRRTYAATQAKHQRRHPLICPRRKAAGSRRPRERVAIAIR
jgi:AraC-like DNA-binding protein